MSRTFANIKGISSQNLTHFYIFMIMMSFTGVQAFKFRHNRAARTPCSESIKTIQKVQNCPTNKESWEERSRLMDCENVGQNCSETSLVYHCLLDQYGKGLMEVCALATEIIGRRCAEFNYGAMFVQEHLEERCKKCPFAYSSREGYLYTECFQLAESALTTESFTIKQSHTTLSLVSSSVFPEKNSSSPEEHTEVTEENLKSRDISITFGILLPFLSMALVLLLMKQRCTSKKSKEEYLHSIESVALMTTNDQTSDEDDIHTWKDENSYFIETKHFTAMMEKVQKQNYMTFVGVPGSGSSATIRHIALKLQDEGYEVVPVQDIRDLQSQFHDLHNPQVFVIDDVIGVLSLQRAKLSYLLQCEQTITNPRIKKSKVLMSCREELFDKCCISFFTNEQHVIRMHNSEDTLSDDDKKQILEKHGIDRDLHSPSSLRKSSRIFPLLCKLYSKEEHFRAHGEKFFISPLQCIFRELDNMQNENNVCYPTLVLCMFNSNKLSEEILENEANEHFKEIKSSVLQNCLIESDIETVMFVKALSAMNGIFTKRCGTGYAIIHDVLFEIIACHYGSQFPELILKYMSSSYIACNVKANSLTKSEVEYKLDTCSENNDERMERFDLSIKLHSKYYSLLAERLYKDLEKMELHDVFTNDVLKHPEVCQLFLAVLQKEAYEKIKFLFLSAQEDVFKLLIQGVDAGMKGREMDERNEEWRKQQLMVQRKLIGNKTENCVRGISWVVYYGHHQILHYIVEETEKRKETESEVFHEFARNSKWDHFESNSFAKQKKTYAEDGVLDSYDTTKEKETYETSKKKGNIGSCMFASERTRLLVLACYSSDVETVKILLKYVDKDSVNRSLQLCTDFRVSWGWDTPLTAACESGKMTIVKELLQIGANVNQGGKYVTPLIAACQGGYLDILEKLLEVGADVNLPGTFDTPLTAACRGGYISVMKILLKYGADVNQQGKYDTPLTAACKDGHLDLVLELLNAGADVNLKDKSNENPLTAAYNAGHDNVVRELRNFGTDFSLSNIPCVDNEADGSVPEELMAGRIYLR